MATRAYQYEFEGNTQTTNVTVNFTQCTEVFPPEQGLAEQEVQDITITIPSPIEVDLKVYFERTTTRLIDGFPPNIQSGTTYFFLPAGETSRTLTVDCKTVVREENDRAEYEKQFSYTFIEQPASEIPPEQEEPIEPSRPEQEPFSTIPRWYFEFEKIRESDPPAQCRIEIYTKEATTTSTEIQHMQNTPITIKRNGNEEDLFEPLIGAVAEVNLIGNQENEYIKLFSSQDAEAKLCYWEDDTLLFEGYSVASQYAEAWTDPPYYIQAIFSDGISLLRQRDFQLPTSNFKKKPLEIIQHCLSRIPSGQDILTNVHTVASQMPSGVDTLVEEEIDVRTFIKDGKPLSCATVIEQLISKLNARFFSSNKRNNEMCWVIEEVNARASSTNDFTVYPPDSLISTGSEQPLNRIIENSNNIRAGIIINQSGIKRQKKVLSKVVVTQNMQKPRSILNLESGKFVFERFDVSQNPTFGYLAGWDYTGDIHTNAYNTYTSQDVNRSLQIYTGDHTKNTDEWAINPVAYISSDPVSVTSNTGNTISFDFRLNFRLKDNSTTTVSKIRELRLREEYIPAILPIQLTVTDSSGTTYYANQNGAWSELFQYIEITATTYNNFFNFQLSNFQPPVDGEFSLRIYTPVPFFSSGDSAAELKDLIEGVAIDYIDVIYNTNSDFLTTQKVVTYKNNRIKSSNNKEYTLELNLGDAESLDNVSAISYNNSPTSGWTRSYVSGDTPTSLVELAARKILEQYNSNEALVLEDFSFLENGADFSNRPFCFHQAIGLRDYVARNFIPVRHEYIPRSMVGGVVRGALIRGTYVEARNDSILDSDLERLIEEKKNNTSTGSGSGGRTSSTTTVIENDFDIRSLITTGTPTNPLKIQLDADQKLAIQTPDLQEVTDVGNTTDNPITVRNLQVSNGVDSISYTVNATIAQSSYTFSADNQIFFRISGNTKLQADTQGVKIIDRTSAFPSTSLASFTTGGILQEVSLGEGLFFSGNTINVSGSTSGNTASQDLQSVTDEGNTTNNIIYAQSFNSLSNQTSYANGQINQFSNNFTVSVSSGNIIFSQSGSTSGYFGADQRFNLQHTNINNPSSLAGFESGFLGEINVGEGLAFSGNTLTVTGSTSGGTDTNNFVSSASFNDTTGELTLNREGLNSITVDLDNRYLTGFTETDPTVPGHVKSISNTDISNWNSAYQFVTGYTAYVLPYASPSQLGGIKIGTGLSINGSGVVSVTGTTNPATDENDYVNAVSFNDSTGILTLNRTGSLSDLTVNLDGRYSQTDTNNYLNSASFNNTNGILTLNRTGLSDLTVDLDGRYSLSDTNNYVNSASFNTSTGVLTLNRQGLGNLLINFEGRYVLPADVVWEEGSQSSYVTLKSGYNRVGIGTTSPSHELDIRTSDTSSATINLQNTQGNALISVNNSGDLQLSSSAGNEIELTTTAGTLFRLFSSGLVQINNLPSSAPGTTNCLWNDAGTLKIS